MRTARQLIIFLVFVVGIVVVLSFLFNGGRRGNKVTVPEVDLVSYATKDSKVIAITDGPITGDDTHRAIRITVDRHSRTMDVIEGYQGKVVASRSYVNNQKAYNEFIHALDRAGFSKPRNTNLDSEKGVCATGRRYIFELTENDKSVSRTWTASCAKGNTSAEPSRVTNLFRKQITDYDELVRGLTL